MARTTPVCPKMLPNDNKNKEKVHFKLPEEDVRAITTAMLLSIWYLLLSLTSSSLFILSGRIPNSEMGPEQRKCFYSVIHLPLIVNNSFNFFFYLRGKSIRETFQQRWLPTCATGRNVIWDSKTAGYFPGRAFFVKRLCFPKIPFISAHCSRSRMCWCAIIVANFSEKLKIVGLWPTSANTFADILEEEQC